MNKEQIQLLRDMQGFIEWSIKSGRELTWVLLNIGHDINGVVLGDKWFSPRVSGYAKFLKLKKEVGAK